MGIGFCNNWKQDQEFIFIDFSLREGRMITLGFFGFGMVIAI